MENKIKLNELSPKPSPFSSVTYSTHTAAVYYDGPIVLKRKHNTNSSGLNSGYRFHVCEKDNGKILKSTTVSNRHALFTEQDTTPVNYFPSICLVGFTGTVSQRYKAYNQTPRWFCASINEPCIKKEIEDVVFDYYKIIKKCKLLPCTVTKNMFCKNYSVMVDLHKESTNAVYVIFCMLRYLRDDPLFVRALVKAVQQGADPITAFVALTETHIHNSGHHILNRNSFGSRYNVYVSLKRIAALHSYIKNNSKEKSFDYDLRERKYVVWSAQTACSSKFISNVASDSKIAADYLLNTNKISTFAKRVNCNSSKMANYINKLIKNKEIKKSNIRGIL